MRIREVSLKGSGCTTLAENERYSFLHYKSTQKTSFEIKLNSIVVLLLSGEARLNKSKVSLGSIVTAQGGHFCLSILGEAFVAGVRGDFSRSFDVIPLCTVKKVKKSWGYELWYNGEGNHFALKKLFIKSKNRLSLQYHEIKRETQIIYEGKGDLFYSEDLAFSKNQFDVIKIKKREINPGSIVHIHPKEIHQIEATSKSLTIFEVSTPELDDVIRIKNDNHRKIIKFE